jgi:sterol O-acyltransferase
MSTSAQVQVQLNGNGNIGHDHILRPRAVKPGNPGVLRTLSEEGLLAPDATKDASLNGNVSGQTRYGFL